MRGAVIVGVVLAALTAGPGQAQAQAPAPAAMSDSDLRELLDAARATAKATREGVEHSRVVPDILTQILTKLDKIENKLDKIENAVKSEGRRASTRR